MKNAIAFLKKLKKNNKTEWMHAHKDEYLVAKKEFEFLVQEIIARISEWDSRLPFLEPKNCTFRINRDIRFSDDKRPYKTHMGAYFSYGGKKSDLPGYYLHVAPEEVFVAGGVWMPEAPSLLKLRRHIMNSGDDLEAILKDKAFKKTFGSLGMDSALTRPPKGFSADTPHIDLIKLKSFVVTKKLDVSDVMKPGFGKLVDKNFKLMKPLNDFLYEGSV
ncbi:DUF2461 domain-containing protein [Peredibacter starrii]|uniref:DUF2461 domain-containing protein n=1 Tax=Peredibacter starrii TaxID=28202 RepID=A0AAX4HNI1_9BACT|nr:DUF2461 domain-containing protein [Peredibacter starrii]WPU64821.1 DUF2461 domain-containing protein [Peredibacter starrii]